METNRIAHDRCTKQDRDGRTTPELSCRWEPGSIAAPTPCLATCAAPMTGGIDPDRVVQWYAEPDRHLC